MEAIERPFGQESAAAEANPMSALLDSDYGLNMPLRGEIREGVIAGITNSEVLVDVGAKSEEIGRAHV